MSQAFIGVLFYLSCVSAVSFLLWNSLMTFNSPGNVALFLFLVPVFGVLLSSLVLHESFDVRVLPVLAVVAASIMASQRAPWPQADTWPEGSAGALRRSSSYSASPAPMAARHSSGAGSPPSASA